MAEDTNYKGQNLSTGFHLASSTHIGLRRSENQDAFAVRQDRAGGTLLVVADGMGGHKGGREASRLAIETFLNQAETEQEVSPKLLERGIHEANRVVFNKAERESSLNGMGTTLVASYLKGDKGTVINLGDSRLYLYRQGTLQQITDDHGVVAEMVKRGDLTPEQAEHHPKRNVLSQAIGMKEPPDPDLYHLSFGLGDILLLCTDGLHGMVEDNEIKRILATEWSLQAKCDSLVEAALDGGGRDNITLILAEKVAKDGSVSGSTTDPGKQREQFSEKSREGIGKVGILLLGAVLLGGGIWGISEFDLFQSTPVQTVDTLTIDSTWEELDTNMPQLTPGEQLNDSLAKESTGMQSDTLFELNLE